MEKIQGRFRGDLGSSFVKQFWEHLFYRFGRAPKRLTLLEEAQSLRLLSVTTDTPRNNSVQQTKEGKQAKQKKKQTKKQLSKMVARQI